VYGISLDGLSDHTGEAGTLQEKESQWLLGRLGKSELIQATFTNERGSNNNRASVLTLEKCRR
jgi:hypothetical protein